MSGQLHALVYYTQTSVRKILYLSKMNSYEESHVAILIHGYISGGT